MTTTNKAGLGNLADTLVKLAGQVKASAGETSVSPEEAEFQGVKDRTAGSIAEAKRTRKVARQERDVHRVGRAAVEQALGEDYQPGTPSVEEQVIKAAKRIRGTRDEVTDELISESKKRAIDAASQAAVATFNNSFRGSLAQAVASNDKDKLEMAAELTLARLASSDVVFNDQTVELFPPGNKKEVIRNLIILATKQVGITDAEAARDAVYNRALDIVVGKVSAKAGTDIGTTKQDINVFLDDYVQKHLDSKTKETISLATKTAVDNLIIVLKSDDEPTGVKRLASLAIKAKNGDFDAQHSLRTSAGHVFNRVKGNLTVFNETTTALFPPDNIVKFNEKLIELAVAGVDEGSKQIAYNDLYQQAFRIVAKDLAEKASATEPEAAGHLESAKQGFLDARLITLQTLPPSS